MAHLIKRVTILGTGLIGGSFARALRKYTRDIAVVGWDRPEIALEARKSGAIEEGFFESLEPAIRRADLIYIAPNLRWCGHRKPFRHRLRSITPSSSLLMAPSLFGASGSA